MIKRSKIKSTIMAATVLALIAPFSQAALIIYEGFDYPAASNLDNQSGGSGFSGTWASITGVPSRTNEAPGLTYQSLVTAGNSSADLNSSSQQGNFRSYGTLTVGQTYWYSFLGNQTSTSGDLKLNFFSGNSTDYNSLVGLKFMNGLVKLTFNGEQGSDTTFTNLGTNLFVGRFTISDNTNNPSNKDVQYEVWINPTIGPAWTGNEMDLGSPQLTYTATDLSGLPLTMNGLKIRSNAAWTGTVDEVRLGTTLLDVTPIPENNSLAPILAILVLTFGWVRRRRS